MARRLVEAGVTVVTLKVGDWDTHEKNFIDHKAQLPQLDRGFHALVTRPARPRAGEGRGGGDVGRVRPGAEDLARRRPRPLARGRRGGGRRRRFQDRAR